MSAAYYLILAILIPAHVGEPEGDNASSLPDIPAKIEIHTFSQEFPAFSDCEAMAKIATSQSALYVEDGPIISTQCVNIPR